MKYYDKLILELSQSGRTGFSLREAHSEVQLPENLKRKTALNLPEVSEPDVVRHYTNLSQMNFGVDTGFYPLGSCTMKYNPKINEELAHIPEFTGAHPLMHSEGLEEVYRLADKYLAAITGMSHFTFQPCAGAHGELTGLMLMRAYHESRGDEKRKRIIVPDRAHGSNPGSAAMCGLDVVVVKSGENGPVDVESLKPLLGDDLAGIMLTNPNTLGLFERDIKEIASLVHECGGLLYYDGANMNPLLGVVRPGDMGFDIMHLNLHKTFSTPHGGGGPGSGPVGVNEKLAGLLPTIRTSGFHGNTGVIIKALAYILSLGREHIRLAGKLATLNANYIKESLRDSYLLPIDSVCKHEFVFDGLREPNGVTTLDVAKRLLDYGFHAPTIYFPLLFHQTIMIEPTETESKETMDGFIEVMEKIAREAKEDPELLKTAPHNTPVSRPDETLAARRPILRWTPES